jgi:hypothetical protein
MAAGNWLGESQRQPVVFAVGFVSFAASFFPGHLSVLIHEKFEVCLFFLEALVSASRSPAVAGSSSFLPPVFAHWHCRFGLYLIGIVGDCLVYLIGQLIVIRLAPGL